MSLYHASLYALMKETKRNIHSRIWDNITYGNYWGILLTILTSLLMFRFSEIGISSVYLMLAILFDVVAHYFVFLSAYSLASPILKSLSIFKKKYFPFFIGLPVFIFLLSILLTRISFPGSRIRIVFFYVIFSVIIVFYIISLFKIISKGYSDLGFVYKPFLIGTVGGVLYLISVLIIIFVILKFPTIIQLNQLYYYILFYSILFTFAVLQFLRFVVDYPSAIQPRWKAYLPFDPIRITTTFTVAFLAVSLYFTVQDSGIAFSLPSWAFALVGLMLIPLAALFIYIRAFVGETTLGYWNYIKTEIAAHLVLTLYVLSATVVIWSLLENFEKILFAVFFSLSLLFYLTATLD
jgi:hypothetical protein